MGVNWNSLRKSSSCTHQSQRERDEREHSSAGQSERQSQTEEKIGVSEGCYSVIRQLQGGEDVQEGKEIDWFRAKAKAQTGRKTSTNNYII